MTEWDTPNDKKLGMKRITLFIVCVVATLTAYAQIYHPGEELHYRVSYRAKLFPNTEVATVDVTTHSTTDADGRTLYKVVGYGRTMPAFRWFFNVEDTYTVWVDPSTLQSVRFESDIREGKYTFRSRYDYDREHNKVHTWWQSRRKEPQTKTMSVTDNGMDAVSLYFNLRSIDTDVLQEGESRSLEMVLEDTVRTLDFRFLGREVKKIPKQGSFRTLKFGCQIGTSDGFSFTDGTEFTVWISDDRNKIPLYIESPIRVGSIQGYISSFSGLKYPLDCRTD